MKIIVPAKVKSWMYQIPSVCTIFYTVMCSQAQANTFKDDLHFLKQYDQPIVLTSSDKKSQIVLSAKHQGRVFTSTLSGDTGISHGWINYDALKSSTSGVGGEDRFWLAPIGSQYSLFYPKGKAIKESNWRVPASFIDEAAQVTKQSLSSVSFEKNYHVENHIGTPFSVKLNRAVTLFTGNEIEQALDVIIPVSIDSVGFGSANKLTNTGKAWKNKTGLITPWIMGMFKGHDNAVAVFPLSAEQLSITAIPSYLYPLNNDRLETKKGVVYFKVDGKYRSKMGIKAEQAKPIMGYFNAENNVLTIITFSFENGQQYPDAQEGVVNTPYNGDVISSYNHGAMDGSLLTQSSFFELESSAQLLPLQRGESITHYHQTYHFSGQRVALSQLSHQLLGVTLEEITSALVKH
jgi:hypothetical protein